MADDVLLNKAATIEPILANALKALVGVGNIAMHG